MPRRWIAIATIALSSLLVLAVIQGCSQNDTEYERMYRQSSPKQQPKQQQPRQWTPQKDSAQQQRIPQQKQDDNDKQSQKKSWFGN